MWRHYLLAISALRGPGIGFPLALRFLLGHQEINKSRLSLSLCPGGELGAGVGATVGLLGLGVGGMSSC